MGRGRFEVWAFMRHDRHFMWRSCGAQTLQVHEFHEMCLSEWCAVATLEPLDAADARLPRPLVQERD